MTSPYLKNTRSVEELDALLEEKQGTIAVYGKNLIEKDVPDAVSNINKVCEDSISEIEQKSNQIVARVTSWVETATAEFLNETEDTRKQIENLVKEKSDVRTVDLLTSMISETSYLSVNRISKCAEASIKKIRDVTTKSIQELRTNAADAFSDFRAMTVKATNKIKEAVEKAGKKFATVRKSSDGRHSIEQVKKETAMAIAEAESASVELENAKARTINRINKAVETASRRIEQAHTDAEDEIRKAKEKAERKLKEITEDAINRLSRA